MVDGIIEVVVEGHRLTVVDLRLVRMHEHDRQEELPVGAREADETLEAHGIACARELALGRIVGLIPRRDVDVAVVIAELFELLDGVGAPLATDELAGEALEEVLMDAVLAVLDELPVHQLTARIEVVDLEEVDDIRLSIGALHGELRYALLFAGEEALAGEREGHLLLTTREGDIGECGLSIPAGGVVELGFLEREDDVGGIIVALIQ